MTADDFDAYRARLDSELDEPLFNAASGVLNSIGLGLTLWAIGFALAAIVWRFS